MRVYRVLYYVRTSNGSLIPQHEEFGFYWRAKLQAWLLSLKEEVSPDIGICIFDK